MTGYLATLAFGFVLGFVARNFRISPRASGINVETTERRQMMVKDGAL